MYEKEVTDGEAKLVQMEEANKDPYDIKKYVSNAHLWMLHYRVYLIRCKNVSDAETQIYGIMGL